ncbi:hypothetical protein EI94DRAFT_863673 [Lactarius quietus]|nr:hypothetical protein EI94DRAFT_863673 [Lactarius quietus]
MSEETSPKLSSDQFDALIELLATDDAADDSNFHIAPEGSTSTGLRDGSGKLDYIKIRSLFQQRQTSKNTEHVSPSDPTINEFDPEIKMPEIVVEEPTAVAAFSPPVEPKSPQWVGESSEIEMAPEEGIFPHGRYDLAPQASEDSVMLNLEDALSKAYEEIAELRRRVLELETQTAELLKSNSPKGKLFTSQTTIAHYRNPHLSQQDPGLSDVPGCVSKPIISTLTSVSSHFFGGFIRSLGIESIVKQAFGSVPPISDTERAIQFLIRADELVWRRSRYPNGPSAPVFSQDNIDAVSQRLTLWESIVRAPGPR